MPSRLPEERLSDLAAVLARLATTRYDEAAWEALHSRMWPFVVAVVFRELRSSGANLLEDVAQETFLRLVRYAPFHDLQDPGAFRAYVATVARRAAWDLAAGERKEVRMTEVSSARAQGGMVVPGLLGQVPESVLARAQELLDEDERQLLTMLLAGLSLDVIAEQLRLRYGTVAVRVHRLRTRLRKLLTP